MKWINKWRPLDYTFSYTGDFTNNKATWIMKFSESVSYDLAIERCIPVNEDWVDLRSSREIRNNTWYQYSISLSGTEMESVGNMCFKDEESACYEIATLISMELEEMNPKEMSPEIADLVQIVKLQAIWLN